MKENFIQMKQTFELLLEKKKKSLCKYTEFGPHGRGDKEVCSRKSTAQFCGTFQYSPLYLRSCVFIESKRYFFMIGRTSPEIYEYHSLQAKTLIF